MADNAEFAYTEHEDEKPTLDAIFTSEGYIEPDLQTLVEQAIREYPVQDAEWWLGGVAAIRVVNDWLMERAQFDREQTNGS